MHIKVENISKQISDRVIIEDLSFEARTGYILGILGAESSGKTPILRMVMDIIKPDKGKITFDDRPINMQIRNSIGYLPQERGIYIRYPLSRTLIYFARLKNLARKKAQVESVRLLDRFNLIEYMDTPVTHLPAEIQQKIELMITIIHNPDILILDEPFLGLDPVNQILVHKLIQRFRDEGKTIVLATADMQKAEDICDDIIFLKDGRVLLKGSHKKVHERFKENLILVEAKDNLQPLQKLPGVTRSVLEKQIARLFINNDVSQQQILDKIIRSVNITRVEVHRPTLEDIYLELTQGRGQ